MKFFTKTLLLFVGAIAFQSALTIAAVSGVTERANLADARRELETEAVILYDSLHSWKRELWAALAALREARPARSELLPALREIVLVARMDGMVLRERAGGGMRVVPAARSGFRGEGLTGTANSKEHPYLEWVDSGSGLWLLGVAWLPAASMDVFVLKILDSEFCNQLVLNRRSNVGFFAANRYLAGSFTQPPPADALQPAAAKAPIEDRFGVRIGRESYNVCWQRIGALEGSGDLLFGVFLSDAPYRERLELLDRTVLLVSAASALLTIAASLLLSRAITHPIAELLGGMARLRAGETGARVGVRAGGEIGMLARGFNDMALQLERNRAALHESLRQTMALKDYSEKIVASLQAAIAIVDRNLVVESANPRLLEWFGLAGAVGRRLADLGIGALDADVLAAVRSVLEGERAWWSGVKRAGPAGVYEVKLYPFASPQRRGGGADGCLIVIEDASARTELEEKILRAEKLASLSVLSAGMAHEINNPLGSILSNVQNLLEEETDSSRRVSLEWIEHEARRIAGIVAELLHFASREAEGEGSAQPAADANEVVRSVVRLLEHSLGAHSRVRLEARLARGLPRVGLSREELVQVVLNLTHNSVQAISGEGRVLVTTRASRRDGLVALAVSDTGCGIPPEVLPRIFDPFFSTKPTGVGTGLGLSVVYGIVTKRGGTISVRSRTGRGTRIRLGLPRAEEAER